MESKQIPIEYILYGNYMKYSAMQKLTLESFKGSKAEHVNIYIDMYQMLLDIYRIGYIGNYSILTSSIINLCGHIRQYYRSRHGVQTKIFIVHSSNDSRSNNVFIKDYNKTHIERINANQQMADMVKSNIELLKILCPYLPDIYFISGSFEPSVIMYYTICHQESLGNFNPNIIFSKGICNYQIPAINGNTVIFRQRKKDGEDCSRAITIQNVLNEYIFESRSKDNIDMKFFNSELLSLLITLTNLPSRNINSLLNIKTAVSMLYQAIGKGLILNGYNSDIAMVYQNLNMVREIPIDMLLFINRFKCIDLKYQVMLYMESPESKDETYLLDLEDPNTVKDINHKYFRHNPLDLDNL